MKSRFVLWVFLSAVLIAMGCNRQVPKPLVDVVIDVSAPAPLNVAVGEQIYFVNSKLEPIQVSSDSLSICTQKPSGFSFTVNHGDRILCTIRATQPPPFTFHYIAEFQPRSCPNCQISVK